MNILRGILSNIEFRLENEKKLEDKLRKIGAMDEPESQ
jgi:hypothetical protein